MDEDKFADEILTDDELDRVTGGNYSKLPDLEEVNAIPDILGDEAAIYRLNSKIEAR